MRSFRDENGQTLVLTAFLMCCLFGFMALAIDVGVAFRTQRRTQTQADSAAIAAALCGTYGGQFCTRFGGTDVGSVASKAATSNGMDASASFTLNHPPSMGQHVNTGYYEVVIKQPSPALFTGVFTALFSGGSNNSLNVGARAVAGMVPGTTCMYVLNPDDPNALYVKGGGGGSKAPATIYAPACSIQVNSSDPGALCTTGGSATIDSPSILVVGAQNGKGKCNGTQSNVQTGVGAGTDPLSGMVNPNNATNNGCTGNSFGWGGGVTDTLSQDPSTGAITLTNNTTKATQTVTPGSFTPVTNGPSVSTACFTDSVQLSSNLGSDANSMWVFQNGLNVGGSSHLVINGTVWLAGGTFQESNTDLFINGPTGEATSNPYTGVALVATALTDGCSSSIHSMGTVPAGDGCLQLQFGSGGSTLACSTSDAELGKCNCTVGSGQPGILGSIYAPKDVVYMQDSGSCLSATNLIADEVWDNGALSIYNYNLAYTTSPLDVVRLVE